uniref:Aminotransferase class I/classII large domain-containing protein n=1 Tax=Coccolithus braarudii TaxID=221442 RepID=A0A7S0L3J5_9EUKA|mmetsp:Transcript_13148/g.28360  ORF Transcript_13148/g.28360 Transcript_13148/m.28360 type:complete len:399 (+) Transcript_13148:18-1214(+)
MATTARLWSSLRAAQAHKTTPRVISSGQGAHLEIAGKSYLNFCSSHYLGFAVEPRLKKAAQDAIELHGLGTGYRTLSGTHALHIELERAIAQFKGTEAAVCFTSAYAANASAVQTLLGRDDIVVSDQLNHASVIDAVRVAGVRNKFVYAHSDMQDLEAKLVAASELQKKPKPNGEHPLILIATDGVFSMDGDLAPLPKIVELAKKYDALTLVDDAHGEGVLGKGGRGVVNHFGLEGEVDIEIGSLSKAFSVMGGFIAAKQPLIDHYLMNARQRLMSIALTIPDTAALLEAVTMLSESERLVQKLWGNVDYLRKGFTDLGFDIGHSETPIIPVMLGDEDLAKAFSAKLFEEGVFASPIVFPMVPRGTARVRVIVSASFSQDDCDAGLAAFKKVAAELTR